MFGAPNRRCRTRDGPAPGTHPVKLARGGLALGQQPVAADVAARAADRDVDRLGGVRRVAHGADRRRVDAEEPAGAERDGVPAEEELDRAAMDEVQLLLAL